MNHIKNLILKTTLVALLMAMMLPVIPAKIASANALDGREDLAFAANIGTGVTDGRTILVSAVQTDGKILLGGDFDSFNGNTRTRILRLNADGTEDTSFYNNLIQTATSSVGFNSTVRDIVLQPDGKILLVGSFTNLNGVTRQKLVRLNSDGTEDTSFYTNLGTSFLQSATLYAVALQSDGKILVGGSFNSFNSSTRNGLIRLNSDGTQDSSFYTNLGTGFSSVIAGRGIFDIDVQSDGKIIVSGSFSTLNGTARRKIVRLNSDGTVDTNFYTNLGSGFVDNTSSDINRTVIQPDGKILIAGEFTSFNGTATRLRLVRLNPDGTEDTTFATNIGGGFGGDTFGLALQPDGKILVSGGFTVFNNASTTRVAMVRLNADGTEDVGFYTNLGAGFGGSAAPIYISVTSDNSILAIGGARDTGTFNGSRWPGIVKLLNYPPQLITTNTNSDGTSLDLEFNEDLNTSSIPAPSDFSLSVNGLSRSISSVQVSTTTVRLNISTPVLPNDITTLTYTPGSNPLEGSSSTLNVFPLSSFVNTVPISRTHASGTEDNIFYTGLGTSFSDTVNDISMQSDNKTLIAGSFTTFNGNTRNRLVRLNSDGTEDTTFATNLGTGFSDTVNSISIQSDGDILVGGSFTNFNGNTRNRLVRLNSDGTEDTTFATNLGTGFGDAVNTISLQSDGDILVGGSFTTFNGNTRNYIVRLNSDGTEDTTFATNLGTGFGGAVKDIHVLSDGRLFIAGSFTTFNSNTRNRLVRLNADGTEDFVFATTLGTGFSDTINTISLQSDGDLLVGGVFTTFNSNTRNRLVRLNSDGTEDTTFATNLGTGFGDTVNTIALQSDGDILVGGSFTTFNGNTRNYLVRLNSDGTEDTTFATNYATGTGSPINSVFVRHDGDIFLGGFFTSFNSTSRKYFMRLGTYVFVPEPEVTPTTSPSPSGAVSGGSSVQYCVGGTSTFCAQVPLFQSNPTTGSTTNSTGTLTNIPKFNFTTNLRQGSSGVAVLQLQRLLNALGFTVARTGAGSVGRETNTFGPATRNALARFQKANNITPAVGFFGPVTRAKVLEVVKGK
jgi:uncharacterized delta-60 repeat protein